MRRIGIATFCGLLTLATSASAEEPKGWLEWSWGTPMVTMVKDDSWCRGRVWDDQGEKTITCRYQFVGDIHLPLLALDFQPLDTLSGYTMCFASSSYRAMREVIVEKFGPPTSTTDRTSGRISGEGLGWKWPSGTAAFLMENQMPNVPSCLTVSTKALSDMRRKKEEEKKEQRKKGF